MRRFTLRCLGEGGPPIHNRRVARILSSRGAISRSAREGLSPSNEQGSRRCVSASSPTSDEHSVATCRMAWRGWPKNTASATACQWFVIVEPVGPATEWSSHVGAAIAHDGRAVSGGESRTPALPQVLARPPAPPNVPGARREGEEPCRRRGSNGGVRRRRQALPGGAGGNRTTCRIWQLLDAADSGGGVTRICARFTRYAHNRQREVLSAERR